MATKVLIEVGRPDDENTYSVVALDETDTEFHRFYDLLPNT